MFIKQFLVTLIDYKFWVYKPNLTYSYYFDSMLKSF